MHQDTCYYYYYWCSLVSLDTVEESCTHCCFVACVGRIRIKRNNNMKVLPHINKTGAPHLQGSYYYNCYFPLPPTIVILSNSPPSSVSQQPPVNEFLNVSKTKPSLSSFWLWKLDNLKVDDLLSLPFLMCSALRCTIKKRETTKRSFRRQFSFLSGVSFLTGRWRETQKQDELADDVVKEVEKVPVSCFSA